MAVKKKCGVWKTVVGAGAFAAAFGVAAVRAEDGEKTPVAAANRWVVALDASEPSASSEENARTEAAREKFCADLRASGILADHILVYSATADDAARRPTRETFAAILDALRDVDGFCELYPERPGEDKPYWREDDAPCEIQFYITARGFSDPSGGPDRLVPYGESLDDVADSPNERFISVDEIEDALTKPADDEAAPFERTFLAINFLSPGAATRGAAGSASAKAVDLKRSNARGVGGEGSAAGFRHVRVLTKNERLDSQAVDSFYSTTSEGLAGAADACGNNDGWVSADELAEYVRANGRENAVEIAQNGNAVYSLCRSARRWKPEPEIFDAIERIFVKPEYKAISDSAKARRAKREGAAK